VSPQALVDGGLDAFGVHLFQESFHPSAAGHAVFAPCVAEFVRSALPAGACLPVEGRLRLESAVLSPAA
jgi:hypothetical protein